jgi:hypothetical protein
MVETGGSQEERERVQKEFLQAFPPRVRFDSSLRTVELGKTRSLEHFEYMMALMEMHPTIPFEECSFGSDLLDDRRALAYHIFQRQLGHSRSLVVNANIRNRIGVGAAIRCMLEMYAFVQFFNQVDRLSNHKLIEVFLNGQSFATGGWYEYEKAWNETHSEPVPKDAKQFIEAFIGLPRLNTILKPAHQADEGFSYLYSRYSEFVHPAFGRPREEFESALGNHENAPPRGSTAYYREEIDHGAPPSIIIEDVGAGGFCLELFWPLALAIDPHFDEQLRPQIVKILIDHGYDKR